MKRGGFKQALGVSGCFVGRVEGRFPIYQEAGRMSFFLDGEQG